MKVLYHLRPYFVGIYPYIALNNVIFVVGISIFVRFLLRGHWFFGSKTLTNNAQQTSNHYPIWWKTIRMIIVMHIYILFLLLVVVIFIYYHYNSNNHYYYHYHFCRITVLVSQYGFTWIASAHQIVEFHIPIHYPPGETFWCQVEVLSRNISTNILTMCINMNTHTDVYTVYIYICIFWQYQYIYIYILYCV
jgi:hypothetical protein